MLLRRRCVLVLPGALLGASAPTRAGPRRALADPLRLGVDAALAGLARALQRGFGRDTGLAVQAVPGPATDLLAALERGELDATLTNAPASEDRLEQQGLAHDLRPVASGDFVLVGPAPHPREPDPAGVAAAAGVADALRRIQAAALARPGTVTFLSGVDGSGSHLLEQALWRTARIAPAAPWYRRADPAAPLALQARAAGAYALLERAAWRTDAGAPLAVLVQHDPALAESVRVMRAFRVEHPAGKLFVAWVTGPKGRRVVAGLPDYRAP